MKSYIKFMVSQSIEKLSLYTTLEPIKCVIALWLKEKTAWERALSVTPFLSNTNGDNFKYNVEHISFQKFAACIKVKNIELHSYSFYLVQDIGGIGEGNGTPLQYSWLENPRDRGAW